MEGKKIPKRLGNKQTTPEVLILHKMTYDLGALEHALTLRGYLTQPTRGRSLVEQGAMSEMPLKTQEIVGNRGALWVEDCIIQTFVCVKQGYLNHLVFQSYRNERRL